MLESPIDLPSIYRETACGETRRSIVDDMFADRELVCVGNIDRELVNALILQIRCLEKQDPHAGIAIFINSPGGEVSSGLALYDVMQAALLFLSGDEREMLPHSTVMIHDPLIPSGVGGSALELRSVADRIMRTREVTAQVIANQLAKAGINVEIESVDWNTWLNRVYKESEFEATIVSVDGPIAYPTSFLSRYVSTASDNFVKFNSKAFDETYAKALEETDDAEQVRLFKEAQKIISDECASVYIQDIDSVVINSPAFGGFEAYPLYVDDYSAMYSVQ